MEGWKKLTLKKARVDEIEQGKHLKIGGSRHSVFEQKTNNYAEPVTQSNCIYSIDRDEDRCFEAKMNCEGILKSIVLESLRTTGGYRSIFTKSTKLAETTTTYKKLPKSCYHCNVLHLLPVVNAVNDENQDSCRQSKQKSHRERKMQKKPEGTENSCTSKEKQTFSFQSNTHQQLKLDSEDEKYYREKAMNRNIADGKKWLSLSSSVMKENGESSEASTSASSGKQGKNNRKRLLTEDSFKDIGIKSIEGDYEIDCLILDAPGDGYSKESCFPNKHRRITKQSTCIEEKRNEFTSVDNTPCKNNVKSKVCSNFPGQCSTSRDNYENIKGKSSSSFEKIAKASNKRMEQNILTKNNTTARDIVPIRSRQFNAETGNGMQSNVMNIKTPRLKAQTASDVDHSDDDDDVIITKTVYEGREIVCGENRTLQNRINVGTQLNQQGYLPAVQKTTTSRANAGLCDSRETISRVKNTGSKQVKNKNGECPMCLLKFPPGWTSNVKNQHISECLTDDMFSDQIENN